MTQLMRPDDLKRISDDADMAKAQEFLKTEPAEFARGLRERAYEFFGKELRPLATGLACKFSTTPAECPEVSACS